MKRALANQAQAAGEPEVASDIRMYSKRLMRWKNIGVWLVFISVGVATFASSYLKYHADEDKDARLDEDLQKYLDIGYVFGGLNILVQLIAIIIMTKATLQMKELTKKNNFDPRQFRDIRMNMLVSHLIAIGYAIDYS